MVTAQQVKDAVAVMIETVKAIHDAGEIPAGTLFAALQTKGMGIGGYEAMERQILRTNLVKKTGHILKWVG